LTRPTLLALNRDTIEANRPTVRPDGGPVPHTKIFSGFLAMTFDAKHLQVVIVVAAPHKDRQDVIHFSAWGHQAFFIAHLAQWLVLHDACSQSLQDSTSWPFNVVCHVIPLKANRA
jgi:hypothetical protein